MADFFIKRVRTLVIEHSKTGGDMRSFATACGFALALRIATAAAADRDSVAQSERSLDHYAITTGHHGQQAEAKPDKFAAAIHGFPEVLECHVLMGPVDFLLRIIIADVEAYERFFFEKLSRIPGVQEVNSTIALSEINQQPRCRF